MDIKNNKMSKILVASELFNLFIAIAIALYLYTILTVLPSSEEIVRIILAVAVGYTAANKMAAIPVAKDMRDTSEEENTTTTMTMKLWTIIILSQQ